MELRIFIDLALGNFPSSWHDRPLLSFRFSGHRKTGLFTYLS
jgi:hypothetical protein